MISHEQARELLKNATPGPWHAWWDPDGFTLVSPYGAPATKVLAETKPSTGDERWPNAELIAAAPDLAVTVIALYQQLRHAQAGSEESGIAAHHHAEVHHETEVG